LNYEFKQWFSLEWAEREPSRFAAGGNGGALKICPLPSSSKVLRTGDRPRAGQIDHCPNSSKIGGRAQIVYRKS
jgi:hypothetical protein